MEFVSSEDWCLHGQGDHRKDHLWPPGRHPPVVWDCRTLIPSPPATLCSYLWEAQDRQLPPCTLCSHRGKGLTTRRFMTCSGKAKSRLPETAESCCLWLQTHVSGDFSSTRADVRPAGPWLLSQLFTSTWDSRFCRYLMGRGMSLPRSKEIKQQA